MIASPHDGRAARSAAKKLCTNQGREWDIKGSALD
jgi:hypothetical protein